jgi:phage portal protein BeeE
MVGHAEKSTSWGTGIEQQMIGFLTFSLAPWLRRIEQSIRKDLMAPAERVKYFAEFSVEGLLRADSAARASFYSTMVQNGIYSRDDCRERENLPRKGGKAAELTVQSNLLPIDMLGSNTDDQQARSALVAWLQSDDGKTK